MLVNAACTSKVSSNSIRRLPMRKSPTANTRSPVITNAPTMTDRLPVMTCVRPAPSSGVLRGHERPHQFVVALIQLRRRAAGDDPPLVEHHQLVPEPAGAR